MINMTVAELFAHPSQLMRVYVGEPTSFQLRFFELLMTQPEKAASPIEHVSQRHRCVGMTTAIAIFMLWYAVNYQGRTLLYTTVDHNGVENLRRVVRELIRRIEADFPAYSSMLELDFKDELRLGNNSRMLFRLPSRILGISLSLAITERLDISVKDFHHVLYSLISNGRLISINDTMMGHLVTLKGDSFIKYDY